MPFGQVNPFFWTNKLPKWRPETPSMDFYFWCTFTHDGSMGLVLFVHIFKVILIYHRNQAFYLPAPSFLDGVKKPLGAPAILMAPFESHPFFGPRFWRVVQGRSIISQLRHTAFISFKSRGSPPSTPGGADSQRWFTTWIHGWIPCVDYPSIYRGKIIPINYASIRRGCIWNPTWFLLIFMVFI